MLSRRELGLLRAIYLHGTVTAAADAVHMSQPAASAVLQGMETRLGFALFSRDRRRLRLTTQGRALMPEVLQAMAAMDAVDRLAGDIRKGGTARLSVGAVAIVSAVLLPAALASVRRGFPDLALAVRAGTALEVMEMVADHRVDLGVVITGSQPVGERLRLTRIAPLGLHAVFHPSHPLATASELPGLPALSAQGLVVLAPALPAGLATQAALATAGLQDQPVIEVFQSFTACEFAGEGLGVAIVESLGARYAQSRGLVARPLPLRPDLQLALVHAADRALEGGALALQRALELNAPREFG